MTESQLQTKILKHIKRKLPEAFVWKISDRWFSGVPDILLICNGRFLFIEVKTPRGRVQPIQRQVFKLMRRAGAEVKVVRDIETVKDIVKVWQVLTKY